MKAARSKKKLSQNFSSWESYLGFNGKSGYKPLFPRAFLKTDRVLGKAQGLYFFRDIIAFETAGAELHGKCASIELCLYLHEIRLPGPPGAILRMADIVARDGMFSANFAGP